MAARAAGRWLAAVAVVLVLAAAAYLAVAAWAGNRTPEGTSVAGVDVGGLDRVGLTRRLQRDVAVLAERPLTVVVGSARSTVVPTQLGLGVDVKATANGLTGFSLRPQRLLRQVRGGGATDPVTSTDPGALRAGVEALAKAVDRPVVEGAITFTAKGAQLKPSAEGRAVDQAATSETLRENWFRDPVLQVPATVTPPRTPQAALQQAFDQLARPATAGPLDLTVGDRKVSVPVSRLAPTLSVQVPASGSASLSVDGKALEKAVVALDPLVERKPRDASVAIRGGRPVITPGRTGQGVDPKALVAAVVPALTSGGRAATVRPAVVQPDRTTDEVRKLGIREVVSTFTTRFPYNPPRTTNIRIAAAALDGTLVMPGETFSLNDALGPRTPQKGYREAPVINMGRLEKGYGGGVSQVSTTLFNAVFFAGLDTVEHKPHSFYISRYPEGREATVSFPTVDQKFRNDSRHGILIKTSVSASEITVTFWGTKVWDVAAAKGPRTNVRPPQTIVDTSEKCVEQEPSPGFDVVVTRIFRRDGASVRSERFFTRYIPEDKVTCA